MFIVTQNFQICIALQDLLLAALVDATPAAIFNVTAKVHLYKAGPTPTFTTDILTITECDFHGYAAVVMATVVGPVNLPGGQGVYSDASFLQTTGTSTAQSALGAYVTDTTSATLLGAEQFVTPAPFNVAADNLDYRLILAPKSLWGGQNGA